MLPHLLPAFVILLANPAQPFSARVCVTFVIVDPALSDEGCSADIACEILLLCVSLPLVFDEEEFHIECRVALVALEFSLTLLMLCLKFVKINTNQQSVSFFIITFDSPYQNVILQHPFILEDL